MPVRVRYAAPALLAFALLGAPARVNAQAVAPDADSALVRERYTKREVMVAMRDGMRLFTSIYAPRDTTQSYPILLTRTPYSVAPYGSDAYKPSIGPSANFARDGYIVVYQDVRGRYMSEGTFVNVTPAKDAHDSPKVVDESTDNYDTIDWLLKNVPHNNGRVGTWGISYPGFYASAGAIDAHPAHRAASPQAPIADWFHGDDWRHNGALIFPHAFRFMAGFDRARPNGRPTQSYGPPFQFPMPNGYEFYLQAGSPATAEAVYFKGTRPFYRELIQHSTYDDFWKERNLLPHLRNIKPAVLTVGGLFDAENLYGALQTYRAIEQQSPGTTNTLVFGPWFHGGWATGDGDRLGNISFGSATAEFYRDSIEFPFFSCVLKDRCGQPLPEAYVFETGTNRWRSYTAWPPANAVKRTLYLRANGGLSFELPNLGPRDTTPAYDEYVSDPRRPVPYIPGIAQNMTREYPVEDQRFAAARPDVLVYQTEPLTADLTIAGPVVVRLFASTTGTDADFIVKLIDVLPDGTPNPSWLPRDVQLGGYQMLVRGDVMRARFRNSFERPEPMAPNTPARIEWTLNDVSHTFQRGHRLMVQVQSSWFPLVSRNPQSFVPNVETARETDFRRATMRVYHATSMPSGLEILVVPKQ